MAGCYKPSIKDGGLACGVGDSCPEGFSCALRRCFRAVQDAAPAEVRIDAAMESRPPDAGNDAVACTPQAGIPGCAAQADLACDPVCQTKCCPGQKCTAVNGGTAPGGAADLGCRTLQAPPRLLGETCDPSDAGTPERSDNCAAGLICIDGNNGASCFKLCRGDTDCAAGTRCEERPIETAAGSHVASVCGLPPTPCDPTLNPLSGCPSPRVCYLVTSDRANGDTTICEITSGEKRNLSCRYSRECLTGYTCAASGPGAGYCRPACARMLPLCPAGTTCQGFGRTYDYCY